MDEERIVGLIEKLYIEMQNMRSEMQDLRSEMREEFTNVRAEMQEEFRNVRAEMHDGFEEARKDRARIEYTLTKKIDIVAEGVVQNTDRLDRVEDRVTNLEEIIKERSIVVPKDYNVKLLKKVENE